MRMEELKNGAALVIKPLERRIDAASATGFKNTLGAWIQKGEKLIVLDLSEVDFIDSTGLGAIVSVLKSLGDEGELIICNPRETVMSLFRLTRMNRVFQILPSVEEAVANISGT